MDFSNQQQIALFVSVLFFLMICFLAMGIYQYVLWNQKKKKMLSRTKEGAERNDHFYDKTGESGREGGIFAGLLGLISRFGAKTTPVNSIDHSAMRLKFLRAGIRRPNAVFVFYGCKTILVLALPALYLLITANMKVLMPFTWNMFFCLGFAFAGYYFPDFWLAMRIRERKERILLGFPDALDLLVVCSEAGLGLDSAIYRVAEELRFSNKDISDEFRLVNFEMRSGKSRQDALNNLSRRADLDEVKSFIGLLNQTFQFGTSVSGALRVYSDTFRTNRRQKAEEVAAKLPTKLLFPCILFIFPALFVVILGPAAIQVFQTFLK
ncbi:MAG: type II secretion system F family protein [Desulfobacterales bacterium]|nr:type II secretion system F family protein [Desulfobacterales bacterium]